MVRIVHFRDKCIGCNACVELLPDRWIMSRKDGKSILVGAEEKNEVYSLLVGDDEFIRNQMAARTCPTNIFKVEKVQRK